MINNKNKKLDALIKKRRGGASDNKGEDKKGSSKPAKGKVKRTSFDRLNSAIDSNKFTFDDSLEIDVDYSQCVLRFDGASLVSNNDLLRLDNRDIFKYKKSWERRVKKLVTDDLIENWNKNWEGMVKIEYIYSRMGNFLDLDGMSAALKAVIDGLVVSGLLVDDGQAEIPIQLPYQVKGESFLALVITKIDDPMDFFSDKAKSLMGKL